MSFLSPGLCLLDSLLAFSIVRLMAGAGSDALLIE